MDQAIEDGVANMAVLVVLGVGTGYLFLLSPGFAVLAICGSSALIAINALMLKRTKLISIGRKTATSARQSAPVAP